MKSNHRLNELMMPNRRVLAPLTPAREIGRAAYAPALVPAAVAYLCRWAA